MSEFLGANMNEMEDYESSINFDEMEDLEHIESIRESQFLVL